MTKNLDLSFLKNMPKGRELYSTVYGNVKFKRYLESGDYPIEVEVAQTEMDAFDLTGRWHKGQGECILFPSDECKDWEKWRILLIQEGDFIISKEYNVEFVFKIDGSFNSVANKGGEFIRVMRSLNNDRIAGWANPKQIEKFKEKLKKAGYEIKDGNIEKIESSKFDLKTLQPFDKVLVRDNRTQIWMCEFFGHREYNVREGKYIFNCISNNFGQCIPYNHDTKHLLGTTQEPPEFYNIFNI